MKHRVIYDRILVRRDPEPEETNHVLTPHDVKKPPRIGIIEDTGPEVKYLKIGMRVTFNEYAGYFVQINQELTESDLISMREDEILTYIEQ
jgi:co-chaperonin GroES (HSP10)